MNKCIVSPVPKLSLPHEKSAQELPPAQELPTKDSNNNVEKSSTKRKKGVNTVTSPRKEKSSAVQKRKKEDPTTVSRQFLDKMKTKVSEIRNEDKDSKCLEEFESFVQNYQVDGDLNKTKADLLSVCRRLSLTHNDTNTDLLRHINHLLSDLPIIVIPKMVPVTKSPSIPTGNSISISKPSETKNTPHHPILLVDVP